MYFARPAALRALSYLNYYARHSVTKAVAKDSQVPPDASGLRVPPRGRGKAAHSFYDNFKVPHKVSLRGPNMHVARMHPVPPSAGERYYVRLLLLTVAATSFQELRTVVDAHGVSTVYATFREAAHARGLLRADDAFEHALYEIATNPMATPSSLRNAFVMMVIHCSDGADINGLLRKWAYYLAQDLDLRGHVGPPGQGVGGVHHNVYGRLPARHYGDFGVEGGDEINPPVLQRAHFHQLLLHLERMFRTNYAKGLLELGLPDPAVYAAEKGVNDLPILQSELERHLYLLPEQQGEATDPILKPHVDALRDHYGYHHPEVLTGALLSPLRQGRAARNAADALEEYWGGDNREEYGRCAQELFDQCNPLQRAFVEKAYMALDYQVVLRAAMQNSQPLPDPPPGYTRFLHVQAFGGKGKSHALNCIIFRALHLGVVATVSAFQGIAASLLPKGRTAHQCYGLKVESDGAEDTTSVSFRSRRGTLLAATGLHVIDEVESLHAKYFMAAATLTSNCNNAHYEEYAVGDEEIFGRALVVVSGDMHQGLPITKGYANEKVVRNSLMRALPVYAQFSSTVFTEAMRQTDAGYVKDFLEPLANNTAPGPVDIPAGQLPPTAREIFVYPGCFSTEDPDAARVWAFGPRPPPMGPFPALDPLTAIVCPLNKTVQEHNAAILEHWVGGPKYTCYATHAPGEQGVASNLARFTASEEYMREQRQNGVPSATLELKRGCILILMRNLMPSEGLLNGTRLYLEGEAPAAGGTVNKLHVRKINPDGTLGAHHFIPRVISTMTTRGGYNYRRLQFPVALGYCVTCAKSQGQTLRRLLHDTRCENFAHGVAYVACSRTRDAASMGFLTGPAKHGRATFTNVVYQSCIVPGPVNAAALFDPHGAPNDVESESTSDEERAPSGRLRRAPARPQRSAAGAVRNQGALNMAQRRNATQAQLRDTFAGEQRRFTVAQGARFSAIYQPIIACAWRAVNTGSVAFLSEPLEPSAGGLLFLERNSELRERFVAGVKELCARANANLPLRALLAAAAALYGAGRHIPATDQEAIINYRGLNVADPYFTEAQALSLLAANIMRAAVDAEAALRPEEPRPAPAAMLPPGMAALFAAAERGECGF